MEPLRIKVSHKEAIRLFNAALGASEDDVATPVSTPTQLMNALGCGRVCIGIQDEFLSRVDAGAMEGVARPIILVADKEVYPPVFRIGEC